MIRMNAALAKWLVMKLAEVWVSCRTYDRLEETRELGAPLKPSDSAKVQGQAHPFTTLLMRLSRALPPSTGKLVAIALNLQRLAVAVLLAAQLHGRQEELT